MPQATPMRCCSTRCAKLRHGQAVPSEPAGGVKGPRDSEGKRGRRRKARAYRHVAREGSVESAQREFLEQQLFGDAFGILGPVRAAPRNVIQSKFHGFRKLSGMQTNPAIFTRTQGDPSGVFDGQRKYKPGIIVRMFADEIDAARGADERGWRCAKKTMEFIQGTGADWILGFGWHAGVENGTHMQREEPAISRQSRRFDTPLAASRLLRGDPVPPSLRQDLEQAGVGPALRVSGERGARVGHAFVRI